MKIGICEDEALFLDLENQKVNQFFTAIGQAVHIDTFTDGTFLLDKYAKDERYDLLLLDLQMAHSDGMQVAGEIRKYDSFVPIIFVTGVAERAVEGYHVEALDYVLKSQLDTRLDDALSRFWKKYMGSTMIFETIENETVILTFDRILWLESEKRGTKIVTTDASYYSAQPIGKISALLPPEQFTEIYKSVFVRPQAIKRIGNDYVEMASGDTLPLSRRKKKAVMSLVLELVKGKL